MMPTSTVSGLSGLCETRSFRSQRINPKVTKPGEEAKAQPPHYGNEIYFNNEKLGGVAGYAWFQANMFPPHWRLPFLKYSEEYVGVYITQIELPNNCPLDVATRIFKMRRSGLDPDEEDVRKESESN